MKDKNLEKENKMLGKRIINPNTSVNTKPNKISS